MMRSKSHAWTALASLAIALRENQGSVREWEKIRKYALLVLALAPYEALVEIGVGVELLGEETGLARLGLGVLFSGGQVEDQVSNDKGL